MINNFCQLILTTAFYFILSIHENFSMLNHNHSISFDEHQRHKHHSLNNRIGGQFCDREKSPIDVRLNHIFHSVCGRKPNIDEKYQYFRYLKTGELNDIEFAASIQSNCGATMTDDPAILRMIDQVNIQTSNLTDWTTRMPDKIYAWTVDFHASPAACNMPLYTEIGVVLHAEVDHHPNCEYSGLCKDRLKVLELGNMMVGFSLDPDHDVLKRDFYEYYKNDSEFNRIDVFMCSHPMANCELFEKFEKPMILFATTRLEFGRDDQWVVWRKREIMRWNSNNNNALIKRQREWIEFVIKYYQLGKLVIVANNQYDVEYIEYFTGIRPEYIPSWCGDIDGSYSDKNTDWTAYVESCDVLIETGKVPGGDRYVPVLTTDEPLMSSDPEVDLLYLARDQNATYFLDLPTNKILIAPYRQHLWASNLNNLEIDHDIYIDMIDGRNWYVGNYSQLPPMIIHCNHELKTDHAPQRYRLYLGVVFIPYQTSLMTFFELYRFNIPLFAPTVELLIEWHRKYRILKDRIYGVPERYEDLIVNATGKYIPINTTIPNPNMEKVMESYEYWFKLADIYQFPHITYFSTWYELYEKISITNFTDIRQKMYHYNIQNRNDTKLKWKQIFKKLVPHKLKNDDFLNGEQE